MKKTIGIVGGMGPYAGLDLLKKVYDNTVAQTDQEHLDVILGSFPARIVDRTSYILSRTGINPGAAILEVLGRLEKAGADVVGIPCNTSHSPKIYDVLLDGLARSGSRLKLIHMIEEVGLFLEHHYTDLKHIGVLGTEGVRHSGVYTSILEPRGFRVLYPAPDSQREVHSSIYDLEYGIKAVSNPVNPKARQKILEAIEGLVKEGAECVILGCTELPLAVEEARVGGTPLIDSVTVLARALIREVDPKKLKPLRLGQETRF
ncbi:MAG: Aspartate racemase [Syntrophorhabdus sp. PtaU1.Bin153]|nr:MAG: Aspartate racemase [Syntrophorhabdus sp. PtaU1.Bin153]